MKNIKYVLIVTVITMFLLLLVPNLNAHAASSGKCGNNATWSLDSKGTLTISGKGAVYEYDYRSSPWVQNNLHNKIIVVKIGSGITSVSKNALNLCTSLKKITFSNTVVTIPEDIFFGCDGLTSISVSSKNTKYSSVDGVLFNKKKTKLLAYPSNKKGNYTVPSTVKSVSKDAFYSNRYLKKIVIPASVTSIPTYTLADCLSLTSISVSSKNTKYSSVKGALFNKNKTNLIYYPGAKTGTYTIPSTVKTISDGAFAYSVLTRVNIPASVTKVGSEAFACCQLQDIMVNSKNTKYSSIDGVLFNKKGTVIICWPDGKIGAYSM